LLLVNVAMLLYLALPVVAPVLASGGHDGWARAVHLVFAPFCHQLPERSIFVFGPKATYTRAELVAAVGEVIPLRYTGGPATGYKIAVCQRCLAIYAGWFVLGVVYSQVRRSLKPLPIRWFLGLLVPIAVDGVGQLVGLWHSSLPSRVATGLLFALAIVWLTYPHLEAGMADMRADAARAQRSAPHR